MNYNIFISCNSEDYRIGTEIYEFIVHSGFSVFLADQELRKLGKGDYGREIDSALEQATHLIVIASKIKSRAGEATDCIARIISAWNSMFSPSLVKIYHKTKGN